MKEDGPPRAVTPLPLHPRTVRGAGGQPRQVAERGAAGRPRRSIVGRQGSKGVPVALVVSQDVKLGGGSVRLAPPSPASSMVRSGGGHLVVALLGPHPRDACLRPAREVGDTCVPAPSPHTPTCQDLGQRGSRGIQQVVLQRGEARGRPARGLQVSPSGGSLHPRGRGPWAGRAPGGEAHGLRRPVPGASVLRAGPSPARFRAGVHARRCRAAVAWAVRAVAAAALGRRGCGSSGGTDVLVGVCMWKSGREAVLPRSPPPQRTHKREHRWWIPKTHGAGPIDSEGVPEEGVRGGGQGCEKLGPCTIAFGAPPTFRLVDEDGVVERAPALGCRGGAGVGRSQGGGRGGRQRCQGPSDRRRRAGGRGAALGGGTVP